MCSNTYRIYRKFRYLKFRGTLFRKHPRKVHKSRKSRAWRIIHRTLFLLKKNALTRFIRYERYLGGLASGRLHGYEGISGIRVPVKTSEPTERFKRMKRIKKSHRLKEPKKFNSLYIIYRKIRYLARTGKLFRFNLHSWSRRTERILSKFGNPGMIRLSINSTILFLLAYLFVYLVKLFMIAAAAGSFNIHTLLFYYDIDFLIRSSQWGKDSVQVVYSTGPFAALILSVFAIIAYAGMSHRTWIIRIFLAWIFCHAFIQSVGEIMIGSLLNQGFGYVEMYLRLQDTEKMLISVLSFAVILAAGFGIRRIFLYTGNIYFNLLDRENRFPFIIHQFLVPYIAGTLFIILLKQPSMTGFEITVNASMILLLLPVIILGNFVHTLYFDEEPKRIKIFWYWILAAAITLPLFRIWFGTGIRI